MWIILACIILMLTFATLGNYRRGVRLNLGTCPHCGNMFDAEKETPDGE